MLFALDLHRQYTSIHSCLRLAYPCPPSRPLPPLHVPGRQSTYSLGVKTRPAHYPTIWEDSTITIAAHLTSGMVHRTWQAESQVHEGTSLVRSSFPQHTSVEEEVILSTRVREAWIVLPTPLRVPSRDMLEDLRITIFSSEGVLRQWNTREISCK